MPGMLEGDQAKLALGISAFQASARRSLMAEHEAATSFASGRAMSANDPSNMDTNVWLAGEPARPDPVGAAAQELVNALRASELRSNPPTAGAGDDNAADMSSDINAKRTRSNISKALSAVKTALMQSKGHRKGRETDAAIEQPSGTGSERTDGQLIEAAAAGTETASHGVLKASQADSLWMAAIAIAEVVPFLKDDDKTQLGTAGDCLNLCSELIRAA